MASFLDDSFEATPWQLYLMYLATAVISSKFHPKSLAQMETDDASVLPVFLGPRQIPKILQASLILSVTGFVVVFSLALCLRKQTQPLSFITSPHRGTSGWGPATAWMMGIGNAM